jgi:hypothetical protein
MLPVRPNVRDVGRRFPGRLEDVHLRIFEPQNARKFCYIQSGVVGSLTSKNRRAAGRLLPVLLAILFMGSAEPVLQQGTNGGGASTRCKHEKLISSSAAYENARTALCLLPALLGHARQTSSSAVSNAALPAPSAAAEARGLCELYRTFDSARRPLASHSRHLWQRPPPSA